MREIEDTVLVDAFVAAEKAGQQIGDAGIVIVGGCGIFEGTFLRVEGLAYQLDTIFLDIA